MDSLERQPLFQTSSMNFMTEVLAALGRAFASPRVGDVDFTSDLAASGLHVPRILNNRDPFAQLPSSRMYHRHVCCTLYIVAQGDPHRDADPADSDADLPLVEISAQLGALLSPALPQALTDHAPANYLRAFWPAPESRA